MSKWVIVEHRENDIVTEYTVQRTKFSRIYSIYICMDFNSAKDICDRLNNQLVLTSKIIYP